MITLGSIADMVVPRPGLHDYEVHYLIPDTHRKKFWDRQYQLLDPLYFRSPIHGSITDFVNQDVGYFGLRTHPTDSSRPYFHIGIQLDFKKAVPITPVAKGVLEYSGYGAINGHYVLISHPDVVTEDGYVLHTMYCHLKKPLVTFSSYQKMLREISLGSYPVIPIDVEDVVGLTGNSGVVQGDNPKLYLQMDFRKYGEVPIVIDPFRVLTGEERENRSIKEVS